MKTKQQQRTTTKNNNKNRTGSGIVKYSVSLENRALI